MFEEAQKHFCRPVSMGPEDCGQVRFLSDNIQPVIELDQKQMSKIIPKTQRLGSLFVIGV